MRLLVLFLIVCAVSCKGASTSKKSNPSTTPPSTTETSTIDKTNAVDPTTDTGKIILDTATSGLMVVSDSPLVVMDAFRDVVTHAAAIPSGGTGRLELDVSTASLLGSAKLTSTEGQRKIGDEEEGVATVDGEISDSVWKGTMALEEFKARWGFPKLNSSEMKFDFGVTSSTLKGVLEGGAIKIGDKEVSLSASYDLTKTNGLWTGKVTGFIADANGTVKFEEDFDRPIISAAKIIVLDANGSETSSTSLQEGGTVRVKLGVNSNAAPDWVNSTWDSPASNLEGGGMGTSYYKVGSCPSSAGTFFCEKSRGYWEWQRDFTISKFQPSGKYVWNFSIANAAELTSRKARLEINVTNTAQAGAPEIVDSVVTADAGVTAGAGGVVKLAILAKSESPVNWLNLTLDSPVTNLLGGGMGVSFTQCSAMSVGAGHLCHQKGDDYWFHEYTYTVSQWAENGTYTFKNVSVKNQGDLTSAAMADKTFSVSGNPVADTPVITSMVMKVMSGSSSGSTINAGDCLVNSDVGDPLQVQLVITATSSATVDWINTTFDGPSGNLEGGGSGASYTEPTPGTFVLLKNQYVNDPTNAPSGRYEWKNMSVKNVGEKTSAPYTATSLHFFLKSTCP